MVLIKNTQRSFSLNINKIEKDAQNLLRILDYSDFDLGIWFTTNQTIRKYNRDYRHKDKPTDILSFSYHPSLKPGERIKVATEDDKNLGDLIISVEYVMKKAKELQESLEQRIQLLLIHGICHLLGYDHESDEDYAIMHKKELQLLKFLKK